MRISPLFYPMSAPLNGPLVRAAGRAMRAAAASLEAAGLALQGRKLTEERRESGSTRRGSCSQDARTARARGWPPSRHAGIRPALSRRLPSAVVPSVRWVPLSARAREAGGRGAAAPEAARGVWLASTAACVGDVKLGEQSSAWYGALLNGAAAAPSPLLLHFFAHALLPYARPSAQATSTRWSLARARPCSIMRKSCRARARAPRSARCVVRARGA